MTIIATPCPEQISIPREKILNTYPFQPDNSTARSSLENYHIAHITEGLFMKLIYLSHHIMGPEILHPESPFEVPKSS